MIGVLVRTLFGSCIFIGLMCGMAKAHARRWNRLAQRYSAANSLALDPTPENSKRMQTVFLTGGRLNYNSYKGIVTVGVTPEGIWFRIMLPFSAFHPPLMIPFADLQVKPRQWYLIGSSSYELSVAKIDSVKIVVDDDTIEWIKDRAAILAADVPTTPLATADSPVPELIEV